MGHGPFSHPIPKPKQELCKLRYMNIFYIDCYESTNHPFLSNYWVKFYSIHLMPSLTTTITGEMPSMLLFPFNLMKRNIQTEKNLHWFAMPLPMATKDIEPQYIERLLWFNCFSRLYILEIVLNQDYDNRYLNLDFGCGWI